MSAHLFQPRLLSKPHLLWLAFALGMSFPIYCLGGTTSASPSPLQFIAVTPCRLADTRNPAGPFGGPELAAEATRSFEVPQGPCGIPSSAVAYSLNITVVPGGGLGYLTLWPTGETQPNVSTLNSDGRVKANAAIVPAGANGSVSVYVSDATQMILDIDGYFVPAGTASALAFYAVTPCRIADTRNAVGTLGGPTLAGGQSRSFPVQSSSCGIPIGAEAYSLNITAVPHESLGYLTTWPTGENQPYVSTLNSSTGAVTANAAIVPAGSNGEISIFVSDEADVILDVNGYFATPTIGGLALYAVTPCRVLDTRSSSEAFNGLVIVDVEQSNCALPSTAQAYTLNATAIPSFSLGYLTLWSEGEAQPLVSTLNAEDGAVTSNMAIVPTANGSIDAFSSSPTNLVLDVSSYFDSAPLGPAAMGPVILGNQPTSQEVVVGAAAIFSVRAIGDAPLSYQWNKNGSPIRNATLSTYTTPGTAQGDDGSVFTVTVTNPANRFTSAPANLSVRTNAVIPSITQGPQYISVSQGTTATFTTIAAGTQPLAYQWRKNGVPIAGATGSIYTTPAVTMVDNGSVFSVTVSNSAGSVTSTPANPASPANLVVTSQEYGLGGFQPIYPSGVTDITGVQYKFKIVTNQSQSTRIIFGSDYLYAPNETINAYQLQSNIYSDSVTYENGGCTTFPLLGTDVQGVGSLRNAMPDYVYYDGLLPALSTGIDSSDTINFPIQTYLIDDIPNLYKSDSISQFGINGIEGTITIHRGSTIIDVSGFSRCSLPLVPTTYRVWTITTQLAGHSTVVNAVVAPDADAQYLLPGAAMQFYSEFLNMPGTFTVQLWDFAFTRESYPILQSLSAFTTIYVYDGSGSDYGLHVVGVNGQNRIEYSNVSGNSYLRGNLPFSFAPAD